MQRRIRTIAVTLFNVANNIRWLCSGPRCGFYEVHLPDLQPGTSIMPGKVNPVMCESLMQGAPGSWATIRPWHSVAQPAANSS